MGPGAASSRIDRCAPPSATLSLAPAADAAKYAADLRSRKLQMKYALRVVSVEQSLFEREVQFIIANGADGELGVMARHAPLMTVLKPVPLRIQEVMVCPDDLIFLGAGC